MNAILENDKAIVSIHKIGAELQSFYHKPSQREIIWQGDPKIWGRSSPILFPYIGAVKDQGYYYKDKHYPMTRHGFLRDAPFELLEKRENFVSYIFRSNEETKLMYPFDFSLEINYLLVDDVLTMEYVLINESKETMYYRIGGHTAYNFDISKENQWIEFEKKEDKTSGIFDLDTGLLKSNTHMPLLEDADALEMDKSLFKHDTLLLKDLDSDYLILNDRELDHQVKITCSDFLYVALWTPPGPFLCVEPWHGVTDALEGPSELMLKKDIQKLEAGHEKNFKTIIEVLK